MEELKFEIETEQYNAYQCGDIGLIAFLNNVLHLEDLAGTAGKSLLLSKALQIYHQNLGTVPEIDQLSISGAETQGSAGYVEISYRLNLHFACAGDAYTHQHAEKVRFTLDSNIPQLCLFFPAPAERSSNEEF